MENPGLFLSTIMALSGGMKGPYDETPDSDYVIKDYARIKNKKSKLNRKNRDAIIHYRENNLSHIGE